jgi:cell wall-associated NlpC family hydrolase
MPRKTEMTEDTTPAPAIVPPIDSASIPDESLEATLTALRSGLVAEARKLLRVPYFFGAASPTETDCNGVILLAGSAMGVYPAGPRLSAAELAKLPAVNWDQRAEGDIACFGDASGCRHVMMVAGADSLIGAIHGKPLFPGESDDDYRARMAERGAAVHEVAAGYWNGARIGVVRFPVLVDLSNRIAAVAQRAAELEIAAMNEKPAI